MSAEGSKKAVLAALAANVGIAVAKFVAFFVTRSGSMLAESAHSVADSGNQALLLIGFRRAGRRPDPEHPFGYTRERYFAAFTVAVVLFTLGAGFAAREGVHKLRDGEPIESPLVALAVLAVSMVLEAFSFRTAVREARTVRRGASWWTFVRRSKNADLTVVLLEDTAALVGLAFALFGVGLTAVTERPVFDAMGTLAIAALLGVVAVVLAVETKSLLIGEGAAAEEIAAIRAALEGTPGVEGIIHLRTEHRGPDEILVAAKAAFDARVPLGRVAELIDEAERRIRAAVPAARTILIEPDVMRAGGTSRPSE